MQLKKGDTQFGFAIPGNSVWIRPELTQHEIDKAEFIQNLAGHLNRLYTSGGKNSVRIGIVVADKTRLSQLPVFLPWIEESIENSKLPDCSLTFYVAYGSHPKQSESESLAAYGDFYSRYPFIHHDARSADFQDFGTTSRGTRILINAELFSRNDLVITVGGISHHYFAGFGGGRKLIFPGLAAISSIQHNHSLFLDFANHSLNSNCQSGVLEGNPLANDLEEIYGKLPATIGIHTVLDQHGKVCKYKIGTNYDTFLEACRLYEDHYRVKTEDTFDLVLASAGGFPKDINFIQSHKSIHNAARFLENNGKLILLAECRDGIGNEALLEIFKLKDRERMFPVDREHYENNTGTALAQLEKSKRIQIHLVTSMDEETCKLLGVEKINLQNVQEMIDQHKGSIGVIENASLIY